MSTATKPAGRQDPVLRWALVLAGLLLVMSLAALGAVAWIGSERALNPTLQEPEWSLSEFPDLNVETVAFESRTGVTLSGWFFAGENGATVILCHGFASVQDNLLPLVNTLNGAGYNVFTYNARHPDHGDGVYTTFGILEQYDLMSAIDYDSDRPEVDPDRVGVYGLSLGAATVILAASQDERIRAVVAEAAFSDANNAIASSFERFIGLPAFPFAPVTRMVAERRAGLSMKDAQPVDFIASISPRPILLIHGLDDAAVAPDHSERLYAAAREPQAVWYVPGAGHGGAREMAGNEYDDRIVSFFHDALSA